MDKYIKIIFVRMRIYYVCMYAYVCMYVCNVCMYVCMFVGVYVCMYICMYVCIMYVCMYVHTSILVVDIPGGNCPSLGEIVQGESVRGEIVEGESVRGESVRGESVQGNLSEEKVSGWKGSRGEIVLHLNNCAAELNMGLHLMAYIGLTRVSSCFRDPLITPYIVNSLLREYLK